MSARRTAEIRSLTGLRGVAACWVGAFHYPFHLSVQPVQDLLDRGYLAVDLFFVLSGFVLALQHRGFDGWRGFVRFMHRRAARLLPVYFAATLLCFGLIRADVRLFADARPDDATVWALVVNLLLLQNWGFDVYPLDKPSWSLSAEWAAGLAFPGFLVLAAVAAPVAILVRAAMAWLVLFAASLIVLDGGLDFTEGLLSLVRCGAEFYLGMLAFRLRQAWQPRTAVLRVTEAALLAAVPLLLLWCPFDAVLIVVWTTLILVLAYQATPVAHWLAAAPAHGLGLVSYSLYLIHMPLLPLQPLLHHALERAGAPHARVMSVVGIFALAVLLAAASHRWIERPGRRVSRARRG